MAQNKNSFKNPTNTTLQSSLTTMHHECLALWLTFSWATTLNTFNNNLKTLPLKFSLVYDDIAFQV